ncbi:MAG: transporter substrate-binding domain-containing protein [Gammaproteobacteria bacterium SHHR-1]
MKPYAAYRQLRGVQWLLWQSLRLIGLALLSLTLWPGLVLAEGLARGLEPVSIQLKWRHQFQFAGYYAALEKGFYAEEGLQVRLLERHPEYNAADSVTRGEAEYGTSNIGLLLARQQGKPVVLLAQIFQHSPLVLLTLQESGIQTPFDLRGKRVMFEAQGFEDAPLQVMLHSTLGSLDAFTQLPTNFRNDALLDQGVDAMAAYLTDQPFWYAQRDIPIRILDPRDYGIDHYGDNLFTTEAEIRNHPQRVAKVRRASLRGWRYALQHPKEIIDLILAKYNSQGLTRPQLQNEARQTARMILPEHVQLGHYEPSRFIKIAQSYAQAGLTPRLDIDPAMFYTHYLNDAWLSAGDRAYLAGLPPLRIPLRHDQPPISFIENSRPRGYSVDLMQHLAQMLGLKVQWVQGLGYAQALHALQQDELDLISDYTHVEQRDFVLPTQPTLSSAFVAVGRADSPAVTGLDDLKGKRLAVVKGFRQTHLLQSQYPDLQLLQLADIEAGYRALRAGQADYYIDNAIHAGYFLRANLITDLKIAGALPSEQLQDLQFSLGVSSRLPRLHLLLNRALDQLDNETRLALREKWMLDSHQRELQLTAKERLWLANHPVIRLASDADWLPFEAIDAKGRHIGIAADFMRLLEQRLGVRFISSPKRPWEQITRLLQQRQLDLFSAAMATEPRRAYARFTQPYISTPTVIITREGSGYIDGLIGLRGLRVAVERGYATHDLLRDHRELQLQPHADTHSALMAVLEGRADAYVANLAAASHALRRHGITNLKVSGQLPYRFELALGVRSDWPELVPILQKGLDSISEEERNAILKRWISLQAEPPLDMRLALYLLAGIGLLIGLILYWNHALRVKVRQRTAQLQQELAERQVAEEQVFHQAHYDALTDLPNRFLSLDRLQHMLSEAQREAAKVAVLFLDLDDFKKINDSLGHHLGDRVLVESAQRLRQAVRRGDSVGRLGGDEFIILLGRIIDDDHVSVISEGILASLRESFLLDEREFVLTTCIGIALYPQDGDVPLELLRNAETAMYHAKQQGHNSYAYYTEEMNRGVARRLQLEEQMHGALPRGEFCVNYQAQIDVVSRQVVGFEALLRWHNPLLGDVFPDEFIPIAEQTGLILPIGEFVLNQALLDLKQMQIAADHPLGMAINLSPRQFRDPLLLDKIEQAIATAGVNREQVELEITEGVLMSGHKQVGQALEALSRSGVRIAMDDFGTGYSSLSYLRRYPFHTLKIDREFVFDMIEDEADRELVNATIAMAQALGLKVVGEGVETEQHLALLAQQGCDYAQGYLFGKPAPLKDVQL